MLKITRSSNALALKIDDNNVVGSDDVGADDESIGELDVSKKLTKLESQTKRRHLGNSNNMKKHNYITSKAIEAFNHLIQAFT